MWTLNTVTLEHDLLWFGRMAWAYGLGVWLGGIIWAYDLGVWFRCMVWAYDLRVWPGCMVWGFDLICTRQFYLKVISDQSKKGSISWSDSVSCDIVYFAEYSWSWQMIRLKTPRCQAKMRKSFHSSLLKDCSLLFPLHNHASLNIFHHTSHLLSSTMLIHLSSPMLILFFSPLAQLPVLASQADIPSIPLSRSGCGRCEKPACELDYDPWGILSKTCYACLVIVNPLTSTGK